MKGYKKFALLFMSFTLLTACNNGVAAEDAKIKEAILAKQNPAKDITVNKIDFQVVNLQELKSSFKGYFEAKKAYKGYSSLKAEDGEVYIGIFSGKKNTGGYGIKVLHAEDVEGKTVVTVEETRPKPSTYVTQAITYPYVVIKMKDTVGSIIVRNTKGEEFKDISTAGEEL